MNEIDKATIAEIRAWLATFDISLTVKQEEAEDLKLTQHGFKWLTSLLAYYDANEAKLARMHEVFGSAIADVEKRRSDEATDDAR